MDCNVLLKDQDPTLLAAIYNEVSVLITRLYTRTDRPKCARLYPYLRRFKNHWATHEFLKQTMTDRRRPTAPTTSSDPDSKVPASDPAVDLSLSDLSASNDDDDEIREDPGPDPSKYFFGSAPQAADVDERLGFDASGLPLAAPAIEVTTTEEEFDSDESNDVSDDDDRSSRNQGKGKSKYVPSSSKSKAPPAKSKVSSVSPPAPYPTNMLFKPAAAAKKPAPKKITAPKKRPAVSDDDLPTPLPTKRAKKKAPPLADDVAAPPPVKRGPGRPRKNTTVAPPPPPPPPSQAASSVPRKRKATSSAASTPAEPPSDEEEAEPPKKKSKLRRKNRNDDEKPVSRNDPQDVHSYFDLTPKPRRAARSKAGSSRSS